MPKIGSEFNSSEIGEFFEKGLRCWILSWAVTLEISARRRSNNQ
jgi:hypothetical protein